METSVSQLFMYYTIITLITLLFDQLESYLVFILSYDNKIFWNEQNVEHFMIENLILKISFSYFFNFLLIRLFIYVSIISLN